ncbi:unnamed protein product [Arabis nemorensis]|uniref:Uncharacterized protein n=1 Tax=Arabis nemorensis TaxID=586526 RepID=A0A565BJG1_9BRAS|nr:unnamed protein product [Arabis nemorensis]
MGGKGVAGQSCLCFGFVLNRSIDSPERLGLWRSGPPGPGIGFGTFQPRPRWLRVSVATHGFRRYPGRVRRYPRMMTRGTA